MEREQDDKTSVWMDLLVIVILSNFILQNVQPSLFVPLLLIVFAFFVSLRSRFIGNWMQGLFASAALGVFLRDVYLFQGEPAFFRVVVVLVLLTGLYFLLRRFRRFFLR